MRLILASSSPRRRELLASLGLPFEIVKPAVDESLRPAEDPYHYVARMAREKADAVAGLLQGPGSALILSADTVVLAADTMGVDAGGTLLGKPADAADARRMLRQLRGASHIVCTAISLLSTTFDPARLRQGHPLRIDSTLCTQVVMRPYSDAEIEAYIATGDPLDKAGSYAIQHPDFQPVARIEGCYNTVVGLPMCAVKRGLAAMGLDLAAPLYCDCPSY